MAFTSRQLSQLRAKLPEGFSLDTSGVDYIVLIYPDKTTLADFTSPDDCLAAARAYGTSTGAGTLFVDAATPAAGDIRTALVPAPTPPAELARVRAANAPREVYDADAGEWLPVTTAMREREERVRDAWAMTRHMQAVIVRTVFDEKLYLAAGYESRDQYCDEVLGLDRRTAYRLASVGKTFGPYLPSMPDRATVLGLAAGPSDNVVTAGGDGVPVDVETAGVVQATKVSTLYQLATLDDEVMQELLRGDAITLDSGRTVTLSDLRDATARESTALVKAIRKEYSARLSRDQERAIHAEQERDVYSERLAEAEDAARVGRDLELRYGPIQARAESQMRLIADAREQITRLAVTLSHIGLDENREDPIALPEAVETDIVALVARLTSVGDAFAARQHTVLARA